MEIFKSVDIDGNGRIEKNELEIAFSKTLGRKATEVEVENMFKAVDMNDDGKISFDEYFTIMHVSLNADKEMQKLIDAFEVRVRRMQTWALEVSDKQLGFPMSTATIKQQLIGALRRVFNLMLERWRFQPIR